MVRKNDIKLIDSVVRKLKLSRDQRQLLHEIIDRPNMTYQEIMELAREIRQDYPNK
jgi:hypothetical protein